MCLITVLPSLRPGPEPRPVRRRRERMNSLSDLREVVDVVIGVDTHVHTHSAAVVDTATGGVLGEITVEATTEGYAEVVEFANNTRCCGPGRSRGPVAMAPGCAVTFVRNSAGGPPDLARRSCPTWSPAWPTPRTAPPRPYALARSPTSWPGRSVRVPLPTGRSPDACCRRGRLSDAPRDDDDRGNRPATDTTALLRSTAASWVRRRYMTSHAWQQGVRFLTGSHPRPDR